MPEGCSRGPGRIENGETVPAIAREMKKGRFKNRLPLKGDEPRQ